MIYIIWFSKPLGTNKHRAQTYIGFVEDYPGALERRLDEHRSGQGAKITAAAVKAGAELQLLMTMPGDRKLERLLKRQKNTRRILRKHGIVVP